MQVHSKLAAPRSDYLYVQWCASSKGWIGGVPHGGKKKTLYAVVRTTDVESAADVDKLIYVIQGPDAPNNGTLTAADKAWLDGKSLEEVLAAIKATGGQAFSRGSSAYRGVGWHKGKQKWEAKIGILGKQMQLGRYDSEEEAAKAYDAGARRIHGSKARLNFPAWDEDADAAALASMGEAAQTALALYQPFTGAEAAGAASSPAPAEPMPLPAGGQAAAAAAAAALPAAPAADNAAPAAVEAADLPLLQPSSSTPQQQRQGVPAAAAGDDVIAAAASDSEPSDSDDDMDWWEDSDDEYMDYFSDVSGDESDGDATDWSSLAAAAAALQQQQGLSHHSQQQPGAAAAAAMPAAASAGGPSSSSAAAAGVMAAAAAGGPSSSSAAAAAAAGGPHPGLAGPSSSTGAAAGDTAAAAAAAYAAALAAAQRKAADCAAVAYGKPPGSFDPALLPTDVARYMVQVQQETEETRPRSIIVHSATFEPRQQTLAQLEAAIAAAAAVVEAELAGEAAAEAAAAAAAATAAAAVPGWDWMLESLVLDIAQEMRDDIEFFSRRKRKHNRSMIVTLPGNIVSPCQCAHVLL